MAVGMGKYYEVTITVCPTHEPWTQPVGIKFIVDDQFANPRRWKDALLMSVLAKQILANFAKVFLKAAGMNVRGRS